MAVIECIELHKGREGDFQARQRARRYTRHFRLRTNNNLDGPAVIVAYLSLPALYSSYTSGNDADTAALVENIRVTEVGYRLWEAEVSYSTVTPDSAQHQENPVDRAPVVKWTSQPYQVPITQDINGRPIVNSADDPFDPPIEREEKRPILSVTRFENMFSPGLAFLYENAINSDTFMGALPGFCRLNHMHGERQYEKNAYCWRVDYEFEFRREGFLAKPLDQGFRYYDDDDNIVTIRDKEGTAVSSPSLLNGNGKPLSDAHTTTVGVQAIGQNQLTVNAVSMFPSAPFVIRVESEDMLVTAIAGFVLTVTRGYNGTTQAAHGNGVAVQQQPYYHSFTIYKSLPFADLEITI